MGDFSNKFLNFFKHEEKDKEEDSKESKKKSSGAGFLNNMLIIFLIGVLLVIVGSMFKPSKTNVNTSGATAVASTQKEDTSAAGVGNGNSTSAVSKEYKDKMETELVETLEKIQGVGKVHAMIYFSSGTEQVPVFDEDTSKSVTNEEDTNGGKRSITQENGGSKVVKENESNKEKPFITKTYNPTISGICVVAEGADESVTELRIRQAVIALYGLEDSKVQVYPMEK